MQLAKFEKWSKTTQLEWPFGISMTIKQALKSSGKFWTEQGQNSTLNSAANFAT